MWFPRTCSEKGVSAEEEGVINGVIAGGERVERNLIVSSCFSNRRGSYIDRCQIRARV